MVTIALSPSHLAPVNELRARAEGMMQRGGAWLRYGRRLLGPDPSLVIASIAIGVFGALGAIALKAGVTALTRSLHEWLFGSERALLVLIIPSCGLLASVLFTKWVLGGDLGRGIPALLVDLRERKAIVATHKLYSQVVTSILTVGTGGSSGLEAPIAATGGAWGSNIARWAGFDEGKRRPLLACGSAAGISAIFNAPIAGAIFAMEALLVNVSVPMMVPVLISSASSAFVSALIYIDHPFVLITDTWRASALPWYMGLAVFASIIAIYTVRMYHAVGGALERWKAPVAKSVVSGTCLGLLILFFPALFGEGYEAVEHLLHHRTQELVVAAPLQLHLGVWNAEALLIGLMLLKVVATALTLGGGGNGGMFGPSLFIGGMCGQAFAHAVNLLGFDQLNEVNFTVVGMAAVLTGAMHVPLTAIFLIAEVTGGYALFVPLMLVSSFTYLVSRALLPWSIYSKPVPVKK
jgi:CIC family chloride channel protein